MTKEELLELYKHRYGVGFSLIFNSLTESEKKEFNDISAEQNVIKWRNEGTLIGRIYNFSKEEKDIIIKKIGNVVMNGLVSDTGTFNDLTDDIIVLSLYVYNASIKKMEELQSKKIGRK